MSDLARNKKAFFDYQVLEKYEAGIALQGTEVKSCKNRSINFTDAYAQIVKGEVLLYNVHISTYKYGHQQNHEPMRVRKLLLHKREIRKLAMMCQQKGLTLIPLALYLKHGLVKVSLGVCRGKHKADKRESMKKAEVQKSLRNIKLR